MAELSEKGRRLIDIAMAHDEPPSTDDSWGAFVSRVTMDAPRASVVAPGEHSRTRWIVLAIAAVVVIGAAWWWSERPVPVARSSADARPVATTPSAAPEPAAKPITPPVSVGQLLPAAEAALAADDPDRAMKLLREHAERAPTDAAAPHRMALRVLVLCAQGERAQARDEATAFLAAHGTSRWSDAVRTSCIAR